MKKFSIIISFLLGLLLSALLLKTKNPIKDFYKKFKTSNLSDTLTIRNKITIQNKGVLKFNSNDFEVYLVPGIYKNNTVKTGGILFNKQNNLIVVEQDELKKIFFNAQKLLPQIDTLFNGIEPALDNNNGFNGGIRKFFKYKDDLFGLITLKVKNESCFFASIVNFSKRKEVFRAPCLPEFSPENLDFNCIGGGNVEYKDSLLFSLGTPNAVGNKIARLAQNMNSPYGKVLIFSKQQLLEGNISKYNYKIFTSGHRNIQGLVNLNNEIFGVEHGPMGGDEINFINYNSNYGWPLISLGLNYEHKNLHLPAGPSQKFTSPLFSFIPSVGTSDIIKAPSIISNRYSPFDILLVSSLRGQSIYIVLLEKKSHRIVSVETINVNMRIRQFTYDNNGKLYISTDGSGIFEIIFMKNYA